MSRTSDMGCIESYINAEEVSAVVSLTWLSMCYGLFFFFVEMQSALKKEIM